MKYLYAVILILTFNLITCKQQNQNEKQNATITNKSSQKTIIDDASWVYIINKEIITKEQFEKEYKLFLNIIGTSTGISKEFFELKAQSFKLKEDILQRIINNKLTYKKAIKSTFFQEEDGKNLIKAFFKIALNQYHIYKTLAPKINKPTEKDLISFYKQHKKLIAAQGINTIKDPRAKTILTKLYKEKQLQNITTKEITKFRLENNVKENSETLLLYLTGKIKKEILNKNNNKNKYWLIKINENTLTLKEALGIINFHIKSMPQNNNKTKKQISQYIMSNIKTMEMNYLYLINKEYHLTNEGKQFIKLLQMRSISLYYLMNEIISKIPMPSYKKAKNILKNKKKKKEFRQSINNKKYNDKKLTNLFRQKLYKEKALKAQNEFVNKLKNENKIQISQKYFETKADKIQKEILKNK